MTMTMTTGNTETVRYVWDEQAGTFVEAEDLAPKRKPVKRGYFVRGPVPVCWVRRACSLPGKAPNVAWALWFVRGMRRSEPFKLKAGTLEMFGVPHRSGYYRALADLEKAGLVRITRKPGQSIAVSIVTDEADQAEDAAADSEE